MSAMITSDAIYQLFYDDYETGKSFLHSHTYSGNALAARVACEALRVVEEEGLVERANLIGQHMLTQMQSIATLTGKLDNVRGIGAIVAADLVGCKPRLSHEIAEAAIALGANLRPIGSSVYWLPPLNIELSLLDKLADITLQAINQCI